MQEEFAGVNSDELAAQAQGFGVGSLAYGETPLATCYELLRELPRSTRILDLGSGRGVPVLVAACLGFASPVGLEFIERHVEGAYRVARVLELDTRFIRGDFEELEWPPADLILVSSSAFSKPLRERLERKFLSSLQPGVQLISQDWVLPAPFRLVRRQLLPVSWGTAEFQHYIL